MTTNLCVGGNFILQSVAFRICRKLSPLVRTELNEICRKPEATVCSDFWSMKGILYTVGLLYNEIATTNIDWETESDFYLRTDERVQSSKCCFKYIKNKMMGNVQRVNNWTLICVLNFLTMQLEYCVAFSALIKLGLSCIYTAQCIILYVLSRVTQWLKTGFGLVIWFINNLQVVTTINYYTIAALHTVQSPHTNLFSLLY
jgi:hypothetical protein